MKKDRGAVVVGLLGTLAAAGVVGAVAAVILGGDDEGKTGPTPSLPFDIRNAVGPLVCACVDAGVMDSVELAACVARAHWSDLDYRWPPPANAHVEHSAAWGELVAALDGFSESADVAGVTLCEFLIDGPPPGPDPGPDPGPLPVKPADPIPTPTPTEGGHYLIKSGDTFFENVGDAYGVGPGQSRLMYSKAVNTYPTNVERARYFDIPEDSNEHDWFDGSRISYGAPFQLVYFPTREEMDAI